MRRASDERQIRFDGAGNMLFPGFVIIDDQGNCLCESDSGQVLQFLTESDARKFIRSNPHFTENAKIIEFTFLIPEGGEDE